MKKCSLGRRDDCLKNVCDASPCGRGLKCLKILRVIRLFCEELPLSTKTFASFTREDFVISVFT